MKGRGGGGGAAGVPPHSPRFLLPFKPAAASAGPDSEECPERCFFLLGNQIYAANFLLFLIWGERNEPSFIEVLGRHHTHTDGLCSIYFLSST